MDRSVTPAFTVTTRRELGTNYIVYSIRLRDGRVAHEQIGPYAQGEPEQRVREFIDPPPARPMPPFNYGRAKSGPKPKRGQGAQTPFNDYNDAEEQ